MVINESGAISWSADHLPFGEVWSETGSENDPGLRYPGQWTVPEAEGLGLPEMYYNLYRWYRAGWGRYSQSDPIGLRGGMNLFGYANGNSLRFVDPLGLVAWSCFTSEVSFGELGAAGLFSAVCKSDCVGGKRTWGAYAIGGFGFGAGWAFPAEIEGWDLQDGTATPDATNLEGHFALHGFSVTPTFGFSWSRVEQGLGFGSWGGSWSVGWGSNYYFLTGGSKLIYSWETCCRRPSGWYGTGSGS